MEESKDKLRSAQTRQFRTVKRKGTPSPTLAPTYKSVQMQSPPWPPATVTPEDHILQEAEVGAMCSGCHISNT